MIKTIALIALLAGAAFYALPYVTVYRLNAALENEDAAAVDSFVDFDAMKISFQNDFAKSMNIEAQGTSNFAAALATGIAGAFINTIVSPETMVMTLKDKPRRDHVGISGEPGVLLSNGAWQDMDHFVLYNAQGKPATLLTRTGMRWEVTGMRVN